jgi:hypothetical protein
MSGQEVCKPQETSVVLDTASQDTTREPATPSNALLGSGLATAPIDADPDGQDALATTLLGLLRADGPPAPPTLIGDIVGYQSLPARSALYLDAGFWNHSEWHDGSDPSAIPACLAAPPESLNAAPPLCPTRPLPDRLLRSQHEHTRRSSQTRAGPSFRSRTVANTRRFQDHGPALSRRIHRAFGRRIHGADVSTRTDRRAACREVADGRQGSWVGPDIGNPAADWRSRCQLHHSHRRHSVAIHSATRLTLGGDCHHPGNTRAPNRVSQTTIVGGGA